MLAQVPWCLPGMALLGGLCLSPKFAMLRSIDTCMSSVLQMLTLGKGDAAQEPTLHRTRSKHLPLCGWRELLMASDGQQKSQAT